MHWTELGAFMRTEFLYISAKPKTYRQAPTHWLKFYEEAVIVWGPSRHRAIKEKQSIQQWLGWQLGMQSAA